MAVLITLGNFTVILVYSTEKQLRHSQEIFRLSLGVADIISGLILLPTAVNTIFKTYQYTLQLQTPINIIGQEQFLSSNGSYIYKNTTLTINMLETITMAKNRLFPSAYRNSIGFFTNVSFTVSIYLLTVSGIDRLRSLWKPLHYNQNVSKRFAVLSSIACWILAIFVSVLPTFINGFSYEINANGYTLFRETMALILYLIMIFPPLFATWIISVLTYLITRKTFDRFRNLPANKDDVKNQRKLNFILSLMVFAFSFSLLPSVLVILIHLYIPEIDPQSPHTYNSRIEKIAISFKLTAIVILTSNSFWNFLIYSLRIKTFRKIALEKYKKIWNLIKYCKLFSALK